MKRRISIVVLCFLALKVQAQNDFKNSVQVYFSPEVCYRSLVDAGGTSTSGAVIRLRDSVEVPGFGFSAGLDYERRLLPWFSISGGFRYHYHSYHMPTRAIFDASGNTGTVTADYIYHFADIPLSLRFYYWRKKRWEVYAFVNASLRFNLAMLERYYGTLGGTPFDNVSDITNPGYPGVSRNVVKCDLAVGNGFRYHFNSRFSVGADLFFAFDPVYTASPTPVRELIWRGGGTLGFQTHF